MKKYFVLLIFVGMISVPSAFAEDHSHSVFHSHDGYISHSHGYRHNHNSNEEHAEIDWHSEANGVDAVHENSKIVESEPPLNEPHTHSQTHTHGEFPEHTHTVNHHNHATGTNHPFEVFHVYPDADAQHQASTGIVEPTPEPPPKPKPVPPKPKPVPPPPPPPPPPSTPIQHVPAPQTGGGGGTPPSVTTPRTSPGIVEILPPVNTPGVAVIPAPTTPMPTDEPEVSEPVAKPKPKRKRLRPIPRDPDIPEILPKRCRLLKFQLPKIDIVSVEVFQKPRRVHVTVRHYVKKTISLHCYMLEFTDSEGKFIYRKEARSYKNNGRAWLRYKPNQYEKFGFSQSEFILTSKWIVDKYDMRKKFGVEFGLNFRIYAKNVPYYQPEEGHVLILRAPTDLDKDKELDVVAQYPKSEEDSAPAAPSLIRPKLVTKWASLKMQKD